MRLWFYDFTILCMFFLCLIYNFHFFKVWKLTAISMNIIIAIFIVDGYFIGCKSTINKK